MVSTIAGNNSPSPENPKAPTNDRTGARFGTKIPIPTEIKNTHFHHLFEVILFNFKY